MDVSFTNILQDARQYFQGLPTATCSTTNSSYPNVEERQNNHYAVEQAQERTPAASSYWPQHHETQRSQSREHPSVDPTQRPQETPQPQHNQTANQHTDQLRSTNYHVQNIHQEQQHSVPTSHSYQFSKPREVQQHVSQQPHVAQQPHAAQQPHVAQQQHVPQQQQQQQQYQSHILPNPSYYQVPPASQQTQPRVPSRPQDHPPSSQPYHQVQQPQNHTQHPSQSYSNYQQNRAYYPVHTQSQSQPQSQSYQQSYQVASSQAYSQPQEASYIHQSYGTHTQQPYQNNANYPTSKPPTPVNQETGTSKENQTQPNQNLQTSQPYRTTHNLPPIAALSTLNYHSSRTSREISRITSNKPRLHSSTIPSSSSYSAKPAEPSQQIPRPSMQYAATTNHNEYVNNVQQNRPPTANQNYQYQTPTSSQSSSQYTPTMATQSTTVAPQNHENYAPHQEATKTYQPVTPKTVVQNQQALNQNNQALPIKQKRESPLDLSVKTVRTSADSTFTDPDTNAGDLQRMGKYYQASRTTRQAPMQAPVSYPTYDMYAQQRNYQQKSAQPNAGVPKVDFFPNFNIPAMHQQAAASKMDNRRLPTANPAYDSQRQQQQQNYNRKPVYNQAVSNLPRSSANSVPAHLNSSVTPSPVKKSMQGLPRIDFLPPAHKASSMYAVPSGDMQKKRTSDPVSSMVPNKIAKVDSWRQTIDQQIEQRLSSYAKSRLQQEQAQKQPVANKQVVNGNYPPSVNQTQDRGKEHYPTSYHRPQYNTIPNPQAYGSSNHYNMPASHTQSYVPSVAAHQYPGYPNHGSQPSQQQTSYTQHSLTRTNSNPSLPVSGANRNHAGAADRRVLSLLRNSLEIKGAKEAQKKLELEHHKPREQIHHQHRSDVQQPSTDVMAPLQPKPGLVGRHNMSPFAATSLFERNSNTPPTYKFHLPKAIDSIKFDTEIGKDARISEKNKHIEAGNATISNSNTDLDGFAALLAARIRTKAELKQVGSAQNTANNPLSGSGALVRSSSESQLTKPTSKGDYITSSSGISPPKLTREKVAYLPRRRLFSRTEEDNNGAPFGNVPLRDKSGLRSSSETSVFDFPDSDSETEMPVLERQSLVEMRRDRKTYPKPVTNEEIVVPIVPMSSCDLSFDDACDKFMTQLKSGVGKKRGRRKKVVEPDVLAKLETVVITKPIETPIKQEVLQETQQEIQQETQQEIQQETRQEIQQETQQEEDEQMAAEEAPVEKVQEPVVSDVVKEIKVESDSDSDVPLIKCKKKSSSASLPKSEESADKTVAAAKRELTSDSSDSEPETIKKLSDKLKKSPTKDKDKVNKEPAYGDGTDFHPGWEEEVYKYKRSLRMPASLIHVTRPPQWHRLSTSLPDLDPCPNSPSPSETAEYLKSKIKNEPLDSDMDSNSNFSFVFNKTNYDSEEGSSSIKSVNINKPKNNSSILDRLIERYGAPKRKKKKKEDLTPKIVPKTNNEIELLAAPILDAPKAKKIAKEELYSKEESLLGFRKKTEEVVSSNQFQTVVLSTRTRNEMRVLKQKATIKEVFGEDRPASAPPVTCVDNTETQEEVENRLNLTFPQDDSVLSNEVKTRKDSLKYKLLNNRNQKGNLLKSNLLKAIANKKITSDFGDDDIIIKREMDDTKSETPSLEGDEYAIPARKRMKNIRRKFSSGFDYIRKKKKQVKKDGLELEANAKPKRRGLVPKTSPESVQDIQKEIKMWVMNKGIGETHLHRAARLGYTDITAYCLEKMEGTASPKDNAGYTPLHEACARGHLSIAKLLLLYGANVSESAQGGIRPLHEAAENGFVEMVRLLLSYGADPMLATYTGLTPLSLATDETTVNLLKSHIAELQGEASTLWTFSGPSSCFDLEESGYNPLDEVPKEDNSSEEEDMEFEISENPLPNLYTIQGESQTERWILLQDLSNLLKIKSRDALLKQISPAAPSTSSNAGYKSVLKELKMTEFLEQASCCQYLCAGEKINTRASKIALVKYSDKVRQLLGVEKIIIAAR